VRERGAVKNVVLQQMEHDDMAGKQPDDKSSANPRKPPRDGQSRQPEQPQIQPPLLNDGPELERDSHC
jgi:hypothetical protein